MSKIGSERANSFTVESRLLSTTAIEKLLIESQDRFAEASQEFQENARTSDEVWIVLTCCDSREVLPTDHLTIDAQGRTALCIPLPTIGGGMPSESDLEEVLELLINQWNIKASAIRIVATQHGDPTEVSHQDNTHITCGLRGVYNKFESHLSPIHKALMDADKDELHGSDFDDQDLASLAEHPEVQELLDAAVSASGIPARLILRAVLHNESPDIDMNQQFVVEKLRSELQKIRHHHPDLSGEPMSAFYDHNHKAMQFPDHEVSLQRPERDNSYQDPEFVVISFGPRSIVLPPEVTVSGITDKQLDNAFTAAATQPSEWSLLKAIAESYYAVSHHNHPHDGDLNFRSLSGVVIVCDTPEFAAVARNVMTTNAEFLKDYHAEYKELPAVVLMTLPASDTEKPSVEFVEL